MMVNVWLVPMLPKFTEPKFLLVGDTLNTAGSNCVDAESPEVRPVAITS